MCKAKVYIGTSGFSYSHWRGIFYPENLPSTKRFEFYTNYFQTTEIKLLNEKLGPVLLQLPPSFKADDENIKRLSDRCIVLCLIHKLSPNIYLLYIQILIHQYKICSKAFFYRAALKRKKP